MAGMLAREKMFNLSSTPLLPTDIGCRYQYPISAYSTNKAYNKPVVSHHPRRLLLLAQNRLLYFMPRVLLVLVVVD